MREEPSSQGHTLPLLAILAGFITAFLLAATVQAQNIDHYQCYKAKELKGVCQDDLSAACKTDDDCPTDCLQKFDSMNVLLEDQFGTASPEVKKPKSLCAPVEKNTQGPPPQDLALHYKRYQIKGGPSVKGTRVLAQDQFGNHVIELIKPDSLLVPASKSDVAVGPPAPGSDHYLCYKAKNKKKTCTDDLTTKCKTDADCTQGGSCDLGFGNVPQGLTDQFGSSTAEINKAKFFCTPVEKNNENGGNGPFNPIEHLVGYQIKGSGINTTVHTNDQFGAEALALSQQKILLVPALKNPSGELICGDGVVNQASEVCDGDDDATCPGQCQPDCTCECAPANPDVCTSGSYRMNVLLIIYYHLNEANEPVDPNNVDTTLLFEDNLAYYRASVADQVEGLRAGLETASSYRGYADLCAEPALRYQIVDTVEHQEPVPYVPFPGDPTRDYLDYFRVMEEHNVCDYVNQVGVQEVWLMIPPHFQDRQVQSESKMSGPYGDISNSFGFNEMPQCGQTYRTYTHNYDRSDTFAEVWSHQLEREFYAVDSDLFLLFQGPCYGSDDYLCAPMADANAPIIGRCGNAHIPPNGRFNYDRWNPEPNLSDCRDWDPDGLGTLTDVSCHDWGCNATTPLDNPILNYSVWMWQNLPGIGNDITYQGTRLRNWWDIHGDFDRVMGEDRTLLCTSPNP